MLINRLKIWPRAERCGERRESFTLEEDLERIKKDLELIMRRLDRLEEVLQSGKQGRELLSIVRGGKAGISLYAQSIDLYERLSRARRLMDDPRLADPISKAVVDSLAYLGTATISAITRHVREVRGSSSRTTVRKKLRRLQELGLVERKDSEYSLAGQP